MREIRCSCPVERARAKPPTSAPQASVFRGAEHLLLEINGVDLSVLAHPPGECTGEKARTAAEVEHPCSWLNVTFGEPVRSIDASAEPAGSASLFTAWQRSDLCWRTVVMPASCVRGRPACERGGGVHPMKPAGRFDVG